MLVSDLYNTIFIHINKAGGTSIEHVLRTGHFIFRKHYMTAKDTREFVGESKWKKCFTFAIVRNPWDKMVSLYRYRSNIGLVPKSWNFSKFIHNLDILNSSSPSNKLRNLLRTTNQLEHCVDENGQVILDYIGRFECLSLEWQKISKIIGCKKNLPHVKATKKHQHYSLYYTDELKNIVSDRFSKDIEYFNYIFEDKR